MSRFWMPSGPASGFFCWRLHWPGNESFHLLWNQCLSGSNHKLQPFRLLILASASQEQAPWAQVKTRWKWHVQQSLAQKKVKKLKKLHDLQQKHVRINPCRDPLEGTNIQRLLLLGFLSSFRFYLCLLHLHLVSFGNRPNPLVPLVCGVASRGA